MKVEVVRSARRRKTVEARLVDGVLRVAIPSWMNDEDEHQWVERMRAKFERRADASRVDLEQRARRLARRFGLPEPRSIRWVDNQRARWGSCSPHSGSIRMSSRLAPFPEWVLDYVIVHELAHLVEANHGPRFHDLVARYPLAERAEGFLLAKGIEIEGIDDPELEEQNRSTDRREGARRGEPSPVAPALW